MAQQGGAAVAVDQPAQLPDLEQALHWIGFTIQAQRINLAQEFGDLQTLGRTSSKELRDLKSEYAARTVANGRIYFGLARAKRLQGISDWVRDRSRIDEEPSLEGMDQQAFLNAIEESTSRALIRKADEETASARIKEAAPSQLASEKDWEKWEGCLTNMLSITLGVREVPLVYVIRENVEPEEDEEFETFTAECIAKCPLEGPEFDADARTVHQLIQSYTTGEQSEQWLKPVKKHANGRMDMEALRDHYRGEGNQTRRISDAERLRDSTHYRSEAALKFQDYLSRCQKMFNIYEQVGEPYTEAAKLRFLLDKVNCQDLGQTVASIRSTIALNPDSFTFTSAANHLASQIKPRTGKAFVGAVGAGGGNDDGSRADIMRNGKIHTGYYKNWSKLSRENQQLVIAERERLGVSKGKNGAGKDKNKRIQALEKKLSKQKVQIAALKRKGIDSTDDESDGDDAGADNAGDAFGGSREKKEKKNKKSKK